MTISDRGYNQYYAKPIELEMPSVTNWQSIGGGQIGANQIYGQAITEAQLADGSITSAKIGTISASDITTGTLNGSLVTVTNLNADNITTGTLNGANIEDLAITNGKLASGAVTAAKITAGTITATEIAGSTITGAKIASGTITAGNIAAGTITATQIAASTITGSKIAASTITGTNLSSTISHSGTITSTVFGAGLSPSGSGFVAAGGAYLFTYATVPSVTNIYDCVMNTTGDMGRPTSDKRLKKYIKPMKGALDKILALKPSTFTWKKEGVADMGLIAQDVLEVMPEIVNGSEEEYYGITYSKLITPLIAAVQEQQEIIKGLEARIEALENK